MESLLNNPLVMIPALTIGMLLLLTVVFGSSGKSTISGDGFSAGGCAATVAAVALLLAVAQWGWLILIVGVPFASVVIVAVVGIKHAGSTITHIHYHDGDGDRYIWH